MRHVILCLAFVLFCASSALAQTAVADIDFSQFDFGGRVHDFEPVDDDGDPDTLAWLLHLSVPPNNAIFVRLVVQREDGSLCLEEPFKPGTAMGGNPVVVRVGRKDMLKVITSSVFQPYTFGRVVALDRRSCT